VSDEPIDRRLADADLDAQLLPRHDLILLGGERRKAPLELNSHSRIEPQTSDIASGVV
jgi:hypothetical protein